MRFVGGLLTARYVKPADYALAFAGIFALSLGFKLFDFQIPSKLVQRPGDPGRSFDYGFTLALGMGLLYAVFAVIAAPVVSRIYGSHVLFVACLVLGLQAVQFPSAVASVYLMRNLDWGRQLAINAVGPLSGMVTGLILAIQGFGVWALVYGQLVTVVAGAAALWLMAPRRPRIRLPIPRSELRLFFDFGWPLWLGGIIQVLCVNVIIFEITAIAGLTALAYFRLATSLGQRIDAAEGVVSSVLFPVLARAGTEDRLRRAFVLSGRLILLWAVPTGFGLAVFSADIVHFLLGPTWRAVIPLLWVEGVGEVFNAIATTWEVFYMSTGNTRPSLWLGLQVNLLMMVLMAVMGYFIGFAGIISVIGVAVIFTLLQRRRFILRLLPGVPVLRAAAPMIGCGILAVAVTLVISAQMSDPQTPGTMALRLAVFLLTYGAAVVAFERGFLREGWGIFRSRGVMA